MKPLHERLLDVPQVGKVSWIGVRSEHGAQLTELSEVAALEQRGLSGDVAVRGRPGGNRQVTLFQTEHLAVLTAFVAANVRPEQLRRNLLIAGVNLIALAKLEFRIGSDVVLLGTGACAPCSKMDASLGPGGFQAMRGHGGITAKVLRGGVIRLGDRVRVNGAASIP